jgi:hypothetical protein
MIKASINVTRIDKSAIIPGKNGKYVGLAFFENKNGPDQFGNDGFITQDIPKERRDAGDRGPIIGNWKHMKKTSVPAGKPQGPADRYQGRTHDDTGEEIPF